MAELADTLVLSEDDRLDQAEGLVRSYCRWHIAPSRSGVVYTTTQPTTSIILPSLHVTAITSVVDSDGNAYAATDYTFTEAGILIRGFFDDFQWCREWWPRGTVVTFTHGYDVPPPEVTAVVQAIAQRAVDNPGSRTQLTDGPFSESYSLTGTGEAVSLSLLAGDRAALDPYRIPSRP